MKSRNNAECNNRISATMFAIVRSTVGTRTHCPRQVAASARRRVLSADHAAALAHSALLGSNYHTARQKSGGSVYTETVSQNER